LTAVNRSGGDLKSDSVLVYLQIFEPSVHYAENLTTVYAIKLLRIVLPFEEVAKV